MGPFSAVPIGNLEMVQRRAARFVLNDFQSTTSVTALLSKLDWNSLEVRRKFARLKKFYLVYHAMGGWADVSHYLDPVARVGRSARACLTRTGVPRTNVNQNSFIIKTSKEWNDLPADIFEPMPTFQQFKNRLRHHLMT